MFKLEFDIVDVSFFHYCDTCLYNVDGNIKGPLLKYTVIYPNEKKIYLYGSDNPHVWFCNEICMNIALLQNLSNIERYAHV
jgi:hypothetical protein